ncbi:MAG: hypothetical protein U0R19_32215 [Bryobacteraceae bacterium]
MALLLAIFALEGTRGITVNEYFEADQVSVRPLEYHDGEISPIAEASFRHAAIEMRLAGMLQQLKGKPCHSVGTM